MARGFLCLPFRKKQKKQRKLDTSISNDEKSNLITNNNEDKQKISANFNKNASKISFFRKRGKNEDGEKLLCDGNVQTRSSIDEIIPDKCKNEQRETSKEDVKMVGNVTSEEANEANNDFDTLTDDVFSTTLDNAQPLTRTRRPVSSDGRPSLWKRLSSSLAQEEDNFKFVEELDLAQCQEVLLKPSTKNYTRLNIWLKKCSDEWLSKFLEHNCLYMIFSALNVLSGRQYQEFGDAVLQLDLVRSIKNILNKQVGMKYLIKDDNDLIFEMALGKQFLVGFSLYHSEFKFLRYSNIVFC